MDQTIGRETDDRRDQLRDDKGRFTHGGTGHGGRKKLPEDLKAAFRAACPAALETLKKIMMDNGARGGDRIRAAEIILDRAYGKPTQAVEVDAVETSGGIAVIQLAAVVPPQEGS